MSLVFACIAAHTPLLLPTVGKESLQQLSKTKAAMEKLERDLYLAQPETLVVISPHGTSLPDAVSVNMHPKYVANFEEFGDLSTKQEWKSDIMLIDRFREDFDAKHMPLVLGSRESLDYGTAVPLVYLTPHLPSVRIIPVVTSGQDMKSHYEAGKRLKNEILQATKRIAVIASADLSHRAGQNAPAGFSPRGVEFDEKILDIIAKREHGAIMDFDNAWLDEAQACGAKVLAMLFGIMDDVQHETGQPTYEKPFGVGYLVLPIKIS